MNRWCFALLCGLALTACAPPLAEDSEQSAEALVLLAGNTTERGPLAARLFLAGAAGRILLTNDGVLGGWSEKDHRNLYQIEWTEEFLVERGVPRDKIVKLPFYGSATLYDALAVKAYLADHPMSRLLVVTNDYHAHRALWAFHTALVNQGATLAAVTVPSFGASRLKHQLREGVKMTVYLLRFSLLGSPPVLGAPLPTFPPEPPPAGGTSR